MHAEALEDLLAVAETRSFSRAAERRGVAQPTLSRRIAALEDWAGAALLDRDTHQLRPTAAGEAFLPHAAEAVRALGAGRLAAREARAGAERTVRLACTHMLASTFFPDWFAGLEEGLAPAPTLQLLVADMRACERALARGDAPLLLCHHAACAPAVTSDPGYRRSRLGSDVLVPVAAPAGAGAGGLSEAGTPYLAYREESGLGRILAASGVLARAAGLRPVFHSHAVLTLARLVRQGRGVAWLPLSLVGEELRLGTLARAADATHDVPVEVCLVRHRARHGEAVERLWALASRAAPAA